MTDELLQAILASPDDDGLRLVYADWLLEQPDESSRARGEYIALATNPSGAIDHVSRTVRNVRMNTLLRTYERAWLGPIVDVTTRRAWSRGFLTGCLIGNVAPDVLGSALGHPAWRTVRVLDASRSSVSARHLVKMICERSLTQLRSLCAQDDTVRALMDMPDLPPLIELGISPWPRDEMELYASVVRATGFAKLRRLHVLRCDRDRVPEIARPGLALVVASWPGALAEWMQALDMHRASFDEFRLVAQLAPMLARLGIDVIVRPDADGRWTTLEIRWTATEDAGITRESLLRVLPELTPDHLTRVAFVGPNRARFDVPTWRDQLREALRSQSRARID